MPHGVVAGLIPHWRAGNAGKRGIPSRAMNTHVRARVRLGLGLAIAAALAAPAAGAPPTSPEAESSAVRHADRSTTLYFGSELSPLPSVTGDAALEATVRVVRWGGLAIQPRAGADASVSGAGNGTELGVRVGIGAGWSLAIGERVVVTPMIGYDLYVLDRVLRVHRVALELPVSILVYPHVVVEPFLQIGRAWVGGTPDLAFAFGPRIGLVF
jgi:hypothetical protein